MRNRPICLLFGILPLIVSGCRIWNPNQMFKTGANYDYVEFSDSVQVEPILRAGDRVRVLLLSNEGYTLLRPGLTAQGEGRGGGADGGLDFEIDVYGVVRLPVIDTLSLAGLTVRQAEWRIEQRLAEHFVGPFVQVTITNRRVYVFRGNSEGQIVPLDKNNMTLIEVLALAGGIPGSGKAYKIKLVRGDLNRNPQIGLINLRTPEGMRQADILVRHGDVIYIDPTFESGFLGQLLPFFAFITSAASVYAIVLATTRN